jgi:hypothetical protein
MAIYGLRGTGDWGPDERPKNFRESILFMQPEGDTPLTALLGKTKSSPTDDPEYSWWFEPKDIVRLRLNGALGTSDQLITVDGSDPDSSNVRQNYGSAQHLVPGDILLVEPATDTAVYDHEQMVVQTVLSPTQFTASRGAFGTTAAIVADNVYLTKLGSAFAEGTGEPQSTSRNPIKDKNYTQIFKTSYEITGTAGATRARTGDLLKNERMRRSFDHAKAIEWQLLWGVPSEEVGENGKFIRTTAGIRSIIPSSNTTILADNWGMVDSATAGNNLNDAINKVFEYSSPGGNVRFALCGNGTLNAINKAIMNGSKASNITLNMEAKASVYGMGFSELTTPQGKIMLKTHPMMTRHSLHTNSMFLLDFSTIKWRPLKGRDTKFIDDIQTKGEDVRRGFWMTEAGLMVDMQGQTQGYIGNFGAAFAAA